MSERIVGKIATERNQLVYIWDEKYCKRQKEMEGVYSINMFQMGIIGLTTTTLLEVKHFHAFTDISPYRFKFDVIYPIVVFLSYFLVKKNYS